MLEHEVRAVWSQRSAYMNCFCAAEPVRKLYVPIQVMQVVREQITRTLSSKPTSLELFKNKVNALNYSEILKLRQTERLHQEETLAPPVL